MTMTKWEIKPIKEALILPVAKDASSNINLSLRGTLQNVVYLN
jgi:hypothetical protein